jgi:acyl carrier protein
LTGINVREEIKTRIVTEFMGGQGELSDETRLVEEEIIDSLGIFLLLGFIKERFGVDVEPEDVTMDNFATVSAITNLVEAKFRK